MEQFGKRRDFMKRYVFGKSVKGATHEKNGLPLQDNCKIEEISDKITIIAVADGHGSSKCLRSDRGSLIAVNTFCTVMKTICSIMEKKRMVLRIW